MSWRDYWRGFCEAFDLFPAPKIDGYQHQSEADALRSDWETLGKDMQVAIEKFEAELAAQQQPLDPEFRRVLYEGLHDGSLYKKS